MFVTSQVDTSLPKEKQTSQAKNIVQQKRKAIADLFKYLAKMGLNYRTGLVVLSANDNLYDFTIPPVDLDAAMSYLKSRFVCFHLQSCFIVVLIMLWPVFHALLFSPGYLHLSRIELLDATGSAARRSTGLDKYKNT